MKTMTKTRTPQSKNDHDKKHLLFKKTNPKKNAYQILIAFSTLCIGGINTLIIKLLGTSETTTLLATKVSIGI